MIVLGVTGQSGAGKGELCDFFRKKGLLCLDTDKTAREVVKPGSKCLLELCNHFGNGILLPDGNMDREKVASIVFSDKAELEFLTKTTHKYIIEKIKEWVFDMEICGEQIVILDAPQLFDAGADFFCNFTLCVLADKETRVKRIKKRDKISEENARARIESQKDDEYFIDRCDYVIYNNKGLEQLQKNAERVYTELMSKEEYF